MFRASESPCENIGNKAPGGEDACECGNGLDLMVIELFNCQFRKGATTKKGISAGMNHQVVNT